MSGGLLVDVDWLARALAAGSNQPRNRALCVLHAEWANERPPAEYLAGHVPGALHFDTDWLEDGYPTWRLRDADALRARFGDCGIDTEQTVVVYAKRYATACRVWWTMRLRGVRDVRVLVGGIDAWMAAGLPLSTEPTVPAPSDFTGVFQPDWIASADDVLTAVQRRTNRLVDVRSAAEYRGETSGYDYLERAGRIPGAMHSDIQLLEPLLDRGDFAAVDAWLHASTLRVDGTPIFYCGSGWRSSVAVFAAHCVGITGARNYSDGWCGWSTRYVRDPHVEGATPGWRQEASGLPVARG